MDYQNRAGSKKGGGGIASEAQFNLQRRKQVEELLRDGEQVGYTFDSNKGAIATDATAEDSTAQQQQQQQPRNPYIYKNHSGKLVCKLCNTMHMSWSSVERHLNGKKHGLNVIRRGNMDRMNNRDKGGHNAQNESDTVFQRKVEELRKTLETNGVVPQHSVIPVKDESSGNVGIAVKVDYSGDDTTKENHQGLIITPFIRIVTSLEMASVSGKEEEQDNKKFLVIAYPPFESIAVEIPTDREIITNTDVNTDVNNNKSSYLDSQVFVDSFNKKCTYWDVGSKTFYIQIFFKDPIDMERI